MARPSSFTDVDKAKIFVTLQSNGGNIKRTSRETGISETTVRRFRDEWKKSGPPTEEVVTVAADSFIKDAERVRNKALMVMESLLPEARVGELNAVVGTLTDKINLIRGHATSRQEHTLALPTPAELRDTLAPAIREAIEMASVRQEEIIDAEVVEEVRVLPPGGSTSH